MTIRLLENLRKFQEVIKDAGVAGLLLSLPSPRTSVAGFLAPPKSRKDSSFADLIDDDNIIGVSRDLFASGFYHQAVHEAFKSVDLTVARLSGISDKAGVKLMRAAFSQDSPKLYWSERSTQSQKDEHEGYGHIFAGSMLGIRNPLGHESDWIDSPVEALELIVLAQHLIKRVKSASSES